MKDVAIIVSVVPERLPLLERSLYTWKKSICASGLDVVVCLYIEGIPINEALKHLPSDLQWRMEGGEEHSGSHIKGYSYWLNQTEAKVCLMTHPEILFPTATVRKAFEAAKPDVFATFKMYWLPEYVTNNLNDYPWQKPEILEQCADIYTLDEKLKGEFYWNTNVRATHEWESTTTYAMEHDTLQKMLPFPDFGVWGPDDPWHLYKRRELDIKTHVIEEPILFHQSHSRNETLEMSKIVELARNALGDNTESNP